MPTVRWIQTNKGNWTATWCGKRATVYHKRSGWGVVIDGDFIDATWNDESVAVSWAAEALIKAGGAEEGEKPQLPPPPPPVKPKSPRAHRRDWRPSATILPWWAKELGLRDEITLDAAKSAYRLLARKLHPDLGGNPENMIHLNKAYEAAVEHFLNQPTGITL